MGKPELFTTAAGHKSLPCPTVEVEDSIAEQISSALCFPEPGFIEPLGQCCRSDPGFW
jgi:hypothetical protein